MIPGPVAGEEAASVLGLAAASIADVAASDRERTWIVDVGRVTPRSPSFVFAARAMRTVLIVRGRPDELLPVPARVETLSRAGCAIGLVVVGRNGYTAAEIADFAGCEVLGELPADPSADRLVDEVLTGRRLRSKLWPAVVDLAGRLELAAQPRFVEGAGVSLPGDPVS